MTDFPKPGDGAVLPDEAFWQERRNSPRRRMLKTGKVAFQSRFCLVECAVRDMSETGARLRTQHSVSIPDTFELLIETDGVEVDCEVMWRHERDVGVRFTSPIVHVDPIRPQVIGADDGGKKRSILRRPVKLGDKLVHPTPGTRKP